MLTSICNQEASQQNKRVTEYKSALGTKACFRPSWHLLVPEGSAVLCCHGQTVHMYCV